MQEEEVAIGRAKREIIMQRALAVEENDRRERSKQVSSDQCVRATGIVKCKVLALQAILLRAEAQAQNDRGKSPRCWV